MTFRARVALASAVAVAVAVVLASATAFVALRHTLVRSIDETLRTRVNAVARLARRGELAEGSEGRSELARFGGTGQIVSADGSVSGLGGGRAAFPAPAAGRRIATTQRGSEFTTVEFGSDRLRVITVALEPGTALQVARPLAEVDRDLERLAVILSVIALAGVGLAIGLGWLVARAVFAPLHRLTLTIEDVGETVDLSRRIAIKGTDELGRLAASFNRLLEAVEGSQRVQHQLVADASHELRTPLTSLRTNVEVLQRSGELMPQDRERLLADVVAQTDELTDLVRDMVELARGEEPNSTVEMIALDALVADAVARAEGHARPKGVAIASSLAPGRVRATRARLERAVANVLDNAVQWSPRGGCVEVSCRGATVVVRDHGPGIEPDDLPHIFDRFYRAAAARGQPGSGLGLAIASQIVAASGGAITATNAPGGGARFELRLPEPGADGAA
jgi:two-component system sensor histidine kinase MprB